MAFDSKDSGSSYGFGDAQSPAAQLADAMAMFDNSNWIVTTGHARNSGAAISAAKSIESGDKSSSPVATSTKDLSALDGEETAGVRSAASVGGVGGLDTTTLLIGLALVGFVVWKMKKKRG